MIDGISAELDRKEERPRKSTSFVILTILIASVVLLCVVIKITTPIKSESVEDTEAIVEIEELVLEEPEAASIELLPVESFDQDASEWIVYAPICTTGIDTLILKTNGELWYFGSESAKPVKIMEHVASFQMGDLGGHHDSLSSTAMICTTDHALYGCGDSSYSVFHEVKPDIELQNTDAVLTTENWLIGL